MLEVEPMRNINKHILKCPRWQNFVKPPALLSLRAPKSRRTAGRARSKCPAGREGKEKRALGVGWATPCPAARAGDTPGHPPGTPEGPPGHIADERCAGR